VVAHLAPERWAWANRVMVAKALAEFSHERLLDPQPRADGRYAVCRDDGAVTYRFAGDLLALDHWEIDERGLDLDDCHLIPPHRWQWLTRLAVTFAADVARGRLVCLGDRDDEYRPQQSIRAFFNAGEPSRHYVKTALSVQNMSLLRGLSATYMEGTPAINGWVASLIAGDEVLAASRFQILRERAAVGDRSVHYHAAATPDSPYPRCSPRCGARAPCRRSRPPAAGDDGVAAPRRPRPGARSPGR
jgi:siderophore synthetase component